MQAIVDPACIRIFCSYCTILLRKNFKNPLKFVEFAEILRSFLKLQYIHIVLIQDQKMEIIDRELEFGQKTYANIYKGESNSKILFETDILILVTGPRPFALIG